MGIEVQFPRWASMATLVCGWCLVAGLLRGLLRGLYCLHPCGEGVGLTPGGGGLGFPSTLAGADKGRLSGQLRAVTVKNVFCLAWLPLSPFLSFGFSGLFPFAPITVFRLPTSPALHLGYGG